VLKPLGLSSTPNSHELRAREKLIEAVFATPFDDGVSAPTRAFGGVERRGSTLRFTCTPIGRRDAGRRRARSPSV